MSGPRLSRRRFAAALGAGAAALGAPPALVGAARPRLVVVGGGAGGATAARHVAMAANGAIDVALVEPEATYTSCFYSNLVLGGVRERGHVTHSYDALIERHGIRKVTARATDVDRAARTVTLEGGRALGYERLVLAPGIDVVHDAVPGYSEAAARIAPHAWGGAEQLDLFRARLDALVDGDDVVVVAPPDPYRCPPGPYERASMIARLFRVKGFSRSRVTILDAKESFSKQALFAAGWARHHPGAIEWLPPSLHGGVLRVDAAAGRVETDLDAFEGALLNVIPPQRAGRIAAAAGLVDDSGWCPIEADSMRSALDPDVFVVGDASVAGEMPKSGFAANSQARIAAMHVVADLAGGPRTAAAYANACWSLIDDGDGVKVGASYVPKGGKIVATSTFVSAPDEGDAVRKATYEESIDWYAGIVRDMLG